MNVEKIILDTDDRFRVVSVDRLRGCINVYVESIQAQCLCPNCYLPANKVHSYYTRRFSHQKNQRLQFEYPGYRRDTLVSAEK